MPVLLAGAVIASIAVAVLLIGFNQRREIQHADASARAADTVLSSFTDGGEALQNYLKAHENRDLERLAEDRLTAAQALSVVARGGEGNPEIAANASRQRVLIDRWNRAAQTIVAQGTATLRQLGLIDELFHELRTVIDAYSARVHRQRAAELTTATLLEAGIIVGGSILAFLCAVFVGRRGAARNRLKEAAEAEERIEQRELADSLQIASGEDETYAILRRHLERALPVCDVVVLNRDNSNDRLEVRTTPPKELEPALLDAEPDSCLAVRLGRTHSHGPEREPLLGCTLCGRFDRATCVPSLVGGEVIGSVLARHAQPLSQREEARFAESVSQAAPVLANLRNLAIAETRAMTDALTGLANVRALQDNLKRMLAQASRNAAHLSLLAFDLDHFKEVNDVYGHDKGDEVLATVGDLLAAALRASDFAARNGGEEFVVLLPDTDKRAAVQVANGLRARLEGISIAGVERAITASFGVATFPTDATEPALLLRAADRGLYLAKASGRNAVHAIEPALTP